VSSKTKKDYTGDEDFDALIDKGIRIMKTKSIDYAEAGDRLAEIKETARDVGITPRQVLGVYMNKHYRSLKKWMRGDELKGEPIDEKLCDIQVYSWIAAKLAAEERREKTKPVFGTFPDTDSSSLPDGTLPDDGLRFGETEMWRESVGHMELKPGCSKEVKFSDAKYVAAPLTLSKEEYEEQKDIIDKLNNLGELDEECSLPNCECHRIRDQSKTTTKPHPDDCECYNCVKTTKPHPSPCDCKSPDCGLDK